MLNIKKIILYSLVLLSLPAVSFASIGQGWVYSPSATANFTISSTSPTVNYITSTSTTATSTFANGINLTKGCFGINGTCVTGSGGGGSGTVTSVGTGNGLTGGPITGTGTSTIASLMPPVQDGLVSYVDPSSGFTMGGSGNGNVVRWFDASGNGNDWKADNANQAPYNEAGSGSFSGIGHPIVWRNETQAQNQTRLVATTSSSLSTTAMSIFVIYRPGFNFSGNNTGTTTIISSDSGQFQLNLSDIKGSYTWPHLQQAIHVVSGKTNPAIITPFFADSGIQFSGIVASTSNAEIYENYDATTTKPLAQQTINALWVGNDPSLNQGLSGEVYAILVYNKVLPDYEVELLRRWAQTQWAGLSYSNSQVAVAGDSISQGYGLPGANSAWPAIIAEDPTKKVINYGASGSSASDSLWSTNGVIVTAYNPNKINVAAIMLGTNDIFGTPGNAQTAVTINTTLKNLATTYHTAGYRVVIGTILPRSGFTGTQETMRLALNALIRAEVPSNFDAIADVGIAPELADPTNPFNYSDGTHPTEAGETILALYFTNAINTLLGKSAAGGVTGSVGFNKGNLSAGTSSLVWDDTGNGQLTITSSGVGTATGLHLLLNGQASTQGISLQHGPGGSGTMGYMVGNAPLIYSDTASTFIDSADVNNSIYLEKFTGKYGLNLGDGNGTGGGAYSHYFGVNLNQQGNSDTGNYYNSGSTVFGTTTTGANGSTIVPSARLELQTPSSGDVFDIDPIGGKGAKLGVINNSGFLGLGTSTPVALINSYTTASSTNLLLETANGKGGCLIMQDVGTGASTYTEIYSKGGTLFSKVTTSLTTCN